MPSFFFLKEHFFKPASDKRLRKAAGVKAYDRRPEGNSIKLYLFCRNSPESRLLVSYWLQKPEARPFPFGESAFIRIVA